MAFLLLAISLLLTILLYLYHVNRGMLEVPEGTRRLSPHRWTIDQIKAAYKRNLENPIDVTRSLPPKQHRRYIVVGGSGLVGNWIVRHLLARGEDSAAIRIADIHQPNQQTLAHGVAYVKTNVTDKFSVSDAFSRKWPENVASLPLTVFHTAAVIRPTDRLKVFLPLCRNVNVEGTKNVLGAAKRAGASCLIATSSGSVCIHRPNFWTAPWTRMPKLLTQVISDSTPLPKKHEEFFGNYAVTKIEAERIVRAADDPGSNFRTGCIRPANGVYGVGDTSATITGTYLRRGGNPTWTPDILQNFVNAENVSLAHLLYEQRLVEQTASPTRPNIGGQAFTVTDPNPAIAFSDVYLLLPTLSKTPVKFPFVNPVPVLVMAHLVEWYVIVRHYYLPWLPKITGDIAQLQPSLFSVSNVHTFVDDSRARKTPEEGGLGYRPRICTLDGMCRELIEWNSRVERKEEGVVKDNGLVSVSDEGVDVNLVVPPKKL